MSNSPEQHSVLADGAEASQLAGAQNASRPYGREGKAVPEDALIIVPSRNVVLFPGVVFPLTIGRPGSIAAAQEALRAERPIGLLLQRQPDIDVPGPENLHWVGTSAAVVRYITTPDGVHHAVVKGEQRFRVLQFLEGWPFPVARVQFVDETQAEVDELITTHSRGWTLERMPAVDRALLRIGVWEILYNDEVPDPVAISEAVEAATVLSTDDSAGFVNGLLAAVSHSKA